MQQLVQPNLSVVGKPDWCLLYDEQVFGIKNDPDPDAWQAWLDTQFKHTDTPPNNVCVPLFFSWSGTIPDGGYANWGHAALWVNGQIWTVPLTGSGHWVYPSIAALEKAYGVQYVGWGEDIKNVRLVGEETMPPIGDESTVRSIAATLNVALTDTQVTYYAARPYWNLYLDVINDVNGQRLVAVQKVSELESQLATLQSTSPAPPAVSPETPSIPVEPAARPAGKGSLWSRLIDSLIGKKG
jgi:hypothetical protein